MPAPVIVAEVASKVPALKRLFTKPSHVRAASVAPQLFALALNGDQGARIELKRLSQQAATGRAKAIYADYLTRLPPADETRGTRLSSAGGRGTVDELNALLGSRAGKQVVSSVIRSATRGSSRRKVTRYDPETGRKRRVPSDSEAAASWPSTKREARDLMEEGAPIGRTVATKAAGGAGALGVAGASGAAVAGVVIAGLAIGAAIGTGLRMLFGEAKAVRAEEVQPKTASLMIRLRKKIVEQQGSPLTQAQARKMFQAYEAQLALNGFVKNERGQWYRPRSFVEKLLG